MNQIIMKKKEDKVNQALTRGVEEIIEKKELQKRMEGRKKIRVKFGIDPTSPNIHIGRSIPLLKLKDFQELGHKIVLIIGDFTGVIGDTSDKESERPMLSEKDIKSNLKTYTQQAGKIIDLKKCEVRYNGEWLSKLGYHEISEQANIFSLNDFISRENIKKRFDNGKRVSLRELLYPLMQGYDSVSIKSDIEIGGTDQRFNLLAGREMQRYYNQRPQEILTSPLIEGLDGRKMSSSWGNTINVFDSPEEMYGKIMSLRDELIVKYFILTTRVEIKEIKEYQKEMSSGENPKNYKKKLAFELVRFYHSLEKARKADENFDRVFKEKRTPLNVSKIKIKKRKLNILDLLVELKLVSSKTEAKRLVEQKGTRIGGQIKSNWKEEIEITDGTIVQVGKRRFVQIVN